MGLVDLILSQLYAAPVFYTLLLVLLTSIYLLKLKLTPHGINPFATDTRQERRPINFDLSTADRIIKQGFTLGKVPTDLDAIVIGSGIGGLSAAALLAKSNKRVLVLEQHDQAGGCCHTFIEKGFEFDVGIHYVGKIHDTCFSRTFLDQISDGQIQWQPLDKNYDTVVLGRGENRVQVPIHSGDEFREKLVESFPEEVAAIDQFISDAKLCDATGLGLALLKMLPRWLATILYKTGAIDYISSYTKWTSMNSLEYVNGLTKNQNLRAVFLYCYGDYGTAPSDSGVMMHASLITHFMKGAGYPVGGASQIAKNIVPVIERAGGKVLVRATVKKILFENGKAVGVSIVKGQQEAVDVFAPIIISGAGVFNTQTMVPREIFSQSPLAKLVSANRVRNGVGSLSLFVGLKGSTKSLGLKSQNIWAHTNSDLDKTFREISSRKTIEPDTIGEIPLVFLSFPSAKDPTWAERNPDKTTLTAITCVNYEWFECWKGDQVKHRGTAYDELKDAIGQQMWKQILELYPQLEGKIEYFDVGSPLSNDYYIAANRGEMYGLDHNMSRFQWDTAMALRPDTGIPGLYLTGQDIMTCGFSGALYGGLLSASSVLGRNLFGDCEHLHKQLIKEGRSLNV